MQKVYKLLLQLPTYVFVIYAYSNDIVIFVNEAEILFNESSQTLQKNVRSSWQTHHSQTIYQGIFLTFVIVNEFKNSMIYIQFSLQGSDRSYSVIERLEENLEIQSTFDAYEVDQSVGVSVCHLYLFTFL